MGLKRLVLIGGGGHCRSVLDTVFRMKRYGEIVITDRFIPAETQIMGCRVAGDDQMLPELFERGFTEAFLTVGSIKDTSLKRRLYDQAEAVGFDFPNIIDPSAAVSGFARLAKGVFIGKNAVVNAGANIGKMVIINTGSVIEHECDIGEFSHISVGAILCGGVQAGRDVFVGANATVIQGVKIGRNSLIGAGSLVCKDVPPNMAVLGKY